MEKTRTYLGATIGVLLGICVLAIFLHLFFTRVIDTRQRTQLIEQAQSSVLFVTAADIASLSGSDADLTNPTYIRLKEVFSELRARNARTRFVYILGYRPELQTQFFYVDSEPTTSSEYSPPGQVFPDTRESDIAQYLKGEAYTDGPYRDSWGEWISGYAPIKDDQGTVVALLGIDIATDVWNSERVFVTSSIVSVAVLLSILTLLGAARLRRVQKKVTELESRTQTLAHRESNLREIQTQAQLGQVLFYIHSDEVVVDEQFQSLFGQNSERITLATFLSAVYPEERDVVIKTLEEARTQDIQYTWFNIRIGSSDQGYRKYHFYGTIERDGHGVPQRYKAIMQDITDIV